MLHKLRSGAHGCEFKVNESTIYMPGDSVSDKEFACQCGRPGFDPWVGEDPLEKEMATHSSIAWRIPWIEEPGGLQSMGSQRVRHD